MSRSHRDDDTDDEEDDRPRRRRGGDEEDESDDEREESEEEAESSLGGWRPFGEAVFWGVVFLGLTLVAFSLGEGIGVKRPLAHKEPNAPEPLPTPPNDSPKADDSAFENKIEAPPVPADDPEKKINLAAPARKESPPLLTPVKSETPVREEPTAKLAWQPMLAKTQLKLQPRSKADDGPTTRLEVDKLTKQVALSPATKRTDFDAMTKEVRLEPKGTRLDWPAMVKTVSIEPATTRLDVDRLLRLVTFTPKPKVEPIVARAPAVMDTLAVVPTALQLRGVPSLLQVGKAVVLVAKVIDADGKPLADQVVEWTLDRQGVGEILAVPNNPQSAKPSERPWPTFARTHTAKSAYQLDAAFGGAEIQVGETWIAVESASAGGMHASVQAPAVSSPTNGRASAFYHWDRAKAEFPDAVAAAAGTEATIAAKVLSTEAAPLPDYRVRYTLTDKGGAETPNGHDAFEVESRGDGRAPAIVKQAAPKAGATRGKIELLGRKPLAGRSAVVLATGEFTINWTGVDATIKASAPVGAAVGEWATVSVSGSIKHASAAPDLRLHAIATDGLRMKSGDGDLGPWTGSGTPIELGVRRDEPGAGSIRFEVRQGAKVWASAEQTIRFDGVPSLRLTIRDSVDPAPMGGELEYEVTIENRGSAAARDVGVEFATPVGLELLSAAGNLGGSVRNGKFAPPNIAELSPGGKASSRIRVKPAQTGEVRLVVRLRHPSLASQLLEEAEGTVVYKP